VVRPDQVDAAHVETHRPGGAHGDRPLLGREPDLLGGGAPVKVGPELPGRALPAHGGDDPVADHEGANVGAAGLLDVLLHQDVGVELAERCYHRLGRLAGLGQHHAHALGALGELDHDRRATDRLQQAVDVLGRVGKARDRKPDAVAGQQLQGPELVAGAADGL
jgi:hypothetical protein